MNDPREKETRDPLLQIALNRPGSAPAKLVYVLAWIACLSAILGLIFAVLFRR